MLWCVQHARTRRSSPSDHTSSASGIALIRSTYVGMYVHQPARILKSHHDHHHYRPSPSPRNRNPNQPPEPPAPAPAPTLASAQRFPPPPLSARGPQASLLLAALSARHTRTSCTSYTALQLARGRQPARSAVAYRGWDGMGWYEMGAARAFASSIKVGRTGG